MSGASHLHEVAGGLVAVLAESPILGDVGVGTTVGMVGGGHVVSSSEEPGTVPD